jgi:predicted acetyltransferase
MEETRLIKPNEAFEDAFHDMLQEWRQTGEPLVPFTLRNDPSDFPKLITQLEGYKSGIDIPDSFVPHSTFWLVNQQHKILGVVNIRHRLTESLLKDGGHIGYGIRPLERKKGYATTILACALIEAKKLGIAKALVTCDKDNTGSIKTILHNNGKLFEEYIVNGISKLSFWIDTTNQIIDSQR